MSYLKRPRGYDDDDDEAFANDRLNQRVQRIYHLTKSLRAPDEIVKGRDSRSHETITEISDPILRQLQIEAQELEKAQK